MTRLARISPWGWAWASDQELRARELEEIPYWCRCAEAVRMCGEPGWIYPCRRRFCPRCAERYRQKNVKQMEKRIRKMECPVLGLFRIPCSDKAVEGGVPHLRRVLGRLRRTPVLKNVVGVGWIEVNHRGTNRWLVHAHMVLDLDEDEVIDGDFEENVNAAFKAETNGYGRFSIDPKNPWVEQPRRIARYIVKTNDWCPTPGELTLEDLEILIEAIHAQQLAFAWGTSSRGRHPRKPKKKAA